MVEMEEYLAEVEVVVELRQVQVQEVREVQVVEEK
jgi:hypothetical protein